MTTATAHDETRLLPATIEELRTWSPAQVAKAARVLARFPRRYLLGVEQTHTPSKHDRRRFRRWCRRAFVLDEPTVRSLSPYHRAAWQRRMRRQRG